jgi:hypothetical protein
MYCYIFPLKMYWYISGDPGWFCWNLSVYLVDAYEYASRSYVVDTYEYVSWVVFLLFITFCKIVLLYFFLSTHVWVRISLVYCRYVWVRISSGTPPIYHILEKCTATFSSYLSLKRNPVFRASMQRISRPSYTTVVAVTATCDFPWGGKTRCAFDCNT